MKKRKLAAFVAPAGCGKTTCLTALLSEFPGSVKITATAGQAATARQFLRLLADGLRVSRLGCVADLQRRLVQALAGTGRLLLLDEAHLLGVPALNVLREVYDSVGTSPMVLAATPVLYERLTVRRYGSGEAELLEQLYSRIGIFMDLRNVRGKDGRPDGPRFTVQDIRAVFERGRVRLEPAAASFLSKLASSDGGGGLRGVKAIVELVADLWPTEAVSRERVFAAMNTRLGPQQAAWMIELAEAEADAPSEAAAVG